MDIQLIKGKKFLWRIKTPDKEKINAIACAHNISTPVAQTLFSRDFTSKEEINSFLFCSHEEAVGNPRLLKGAQIASKRILRALASGEKILVFGDYDVDGVTSTALLLVALLPLGANINYYLPHRAKDGYGLSVDAVEKAARSGYKLLITVDNGITAHAAAQKAQELGIDLIITDHHRPHESLPFAHAIIDPSQDDCVYPYKNLAGVGVIFKLVSLLYEEKNIPLPDKIYELLMLGTVADMVPLTGENRFWVRYGLAKTNVRKSLALSALAANSSMEQQKLGSRDIGFMIAPQINALGRLDDPREAVLFLMSPDKDLVARVSKRLKDMNDERKLVERKICDEIEAVILNKQIDLDRENIILAASTKWPSGVIGLVAGRLMQNYGKPTFLFHATSNGVLRGSCRSIPEFDIFKALERNKELLISFGGHACAAGLSLKQENISEFKQRLEDQVLCEVGADALQPKIVLDAHCAPHEMTHQLLHDLAQLEPFGMGNPQPNFLIHDVTMLKAPTLLKDKHVKCSIFAGGIIKQVIFFNRPDLYGVLRDIGEQSFHIAGSVVKNEWNDKVSIEIQGLDVAL